MPNSSEAGQEPCPCDNLKYGPPDANGRRSIFIPETAWADEPLPPMPRDYGLEPARAESRGMATATAPERVVNGAQGVTMRPYRPQQEMPDPGQVWAEYPNQSTFLEPPRSTNPNVCYLPVPQAEQRSTFLGDSDHGLRSRDPLDRWSLGANQAAPISSWLHWIASLGDHAFGAGQLRASPGGRSKPQPDRVLDQPSEWGDRDPNTRNLDKQSAVANGPCPTEEPFLRRASVWLSAELDFLHTFHIAYPEGSPDDMYRALSGKDPANLTEVEKWAFLARLFVQAVYSPIVAAMAKQEVREEWLGKGIIPGAFLEQLGEDKLDGLLKESFADELERLAAPNPVCQPDCRPVIVIKHYDAEDAVVDAKWRGVTGQASRQVVRGLAYLVIQCRWVARVHIEFTVECEVHCSKFVAIPPSPEPGVDDEF